VGKGGFGEWEMRGLGEGTPMSCMKEHSGRNMSPQPTALAVVENGFLPQPLPFSQREKGIRFGGREKCTRQFKKRRGFIAIPFLDLEANLYTMSSTQHHFQVILQSGHTVVRQVDQMAFDEHPSS
jgi:hypothetical protein